MSIGNLFVWFENNLGRDDEFDQQLLDHWQYWSSLGTMVVSSTSPRGENVYQRIYENVGEYPEPGLKTVQLVDDLASPEQWKSVARVCRQFVEQTGKKRIFLENETTIIQAHKGNDSIDFGGVKNALASADWPEGVEVVLYPAGINHGSRLASTYYPFDVAFMEAVPNARLCNNYGTWMVRQLDPNAMEMANVASRSEWDSGRFFKIIWEKLHIGDVVFYPGQKNIDQKLPTLSAILLLQQERN